MATLESEIRVGEDVLFNGIEEEGVLLNLKTGTYYGMDKVGTRMFSLLSQHGQVGLAYQELLKEYDTTEDQLWQDLLNFINELASHELLQVVETQV